MRTIIHLIFRFDIGGLEKVMADTINHTPEYRHIVVSLTSATKESTSLINHPLTVLELNKKDGNDLTVWKKLYHIFLKYKPDILHSYNLSTLEYHVLACFMRISKRIHSEHGRDFSDPQGLNRKHRFLRQIVSPFVHYWVPVSCDIEEWLVKYIKVNPMKVILIHNGIDTDCYKKVKINKSDVLGQYAKKNAIVIGSIGRLDPVKNHKKLIDAFYTIICQEESVDNNYILAIIGDGPLKQDLINQINKLGISDKVWLPGARYNIIELMNAFDIFCLPSLAEGIPITILEAMSTEKPIIATEVGGLPEIIDEGEGILIPPNDHLSLVNGITSLIKSEETRMKLGQKARKKVIENFSLKNMIIRYKKIYK
jgi:sugar transferase (PEP-CTERM/EpsH1 system associated)